MTTSSGSGCEGGKAEGLSERVVEGACFLGHTGFRRGGGCQLGSASHREGSCKRCVRGCNVRGSLTFVMGECNYDCQLDHRRLGLGGEAQV